MDCSILSGCAAPSTGHVTVTNSSQIAVTANSHRAKVFADLLSKDAANLHVYVPSESYRNNHVERLVSSLDSIRQSTLTRFESDRLDKYSGEGKKLDSQLNMSADLINESMRFQVEMVSFQLMSSVAQAIKQGVSTLFQQQG
jgi:hypothetical protein